MSYGENMNQFAKIIEEVICDETDLEENQIQIAHSLYLRELSRLKSSKSNKESMQCLARMIALSPHLDFSQAKRIAAKK